MILSLLNKVSQVPKCPGTWVPERPSTLQVPECPSDWAPKCPSTLSVWVRKCPSSTGVPKVLECSSSQVSQVPTCISAFREPECPSTLWMSLECPLSVHFPFECSLSKKVCDYIFYIILIVFPFLGNKMCKFYHVLLARLSLSIVHNFRKLNMIVYSIIVSFVEYLNPRWYFSWLFSTNACFM